MRAMNLNPKHLMLAAVLVAAGIWAVNRNRANAAPRAGSNANISPPISDAGRLAPVLNAIGTLGGFLGGPSSASAPPSSNAATIGRQAGDPYYTGPSWATQWDDLSQSYDAADYYAGTTGDPYNPDGGYLQ